MSNHRGTYRPESDAGPGMHCRGRHCRHNADCVLQPVRTPLAALARWDRG